MRDVLEAFDRFLGQRKPPFEGIVIGGAALILLGIIQRDTMDVDILDPALPEDLRDAAVRFAKRYRGAPLPLKEDWLNNGPMSLRKDLPEGWRERTAPLFDGKNLRLRTLGRSDLLRAKLFAYCDRQEDFLDCVAMAPTKKELQELLPWLQERDANELWPEHVRRSLKALAEKLGHAIDAGR